MSTQRERPFTRREIEVLNLMAQGFTYKEIAKELGMAYQTAKNHGCDVFYKLGVRSKTEAAALVWTRGLPHIRGG